MTVDSTTSRISKQIRDKWGRWVIQEAQGRKDRRFIIVSAYQPVDKTVHPGSLTVASQQTSLLTASNDSTTNPRTAFRRDLLKVLITYKKQGFLILLMCDFNEPFGQDPDGITKVASELGLIDIMRRRHSSPPPATYARGSTRLDYILTSPEICDALRATGYHEFNATVSSDHRGYFLDLDTSTLFGSAKSLQRLSGEA